MHRLRMAGIARLTTVRLSCALIVCLSFFASPGRGAAQQVDSEAIEGPPLAEQREEETDIKRVKLEALDRLNVVLQTEGNLSAEFKEAFSELIGALRQQAAENSLQNEREQLKQELLATLAEQNAERDRALTAVRNLFDKLDIYGDVRFRHETDTNMDRRPTRNRERFRLRLGAIYRVTDEFDFEARLITGNATDPKSSHQNFGTGFESFDVTLDRINVTYRPKWLPDLWVTAGKFAHPFRVNPVYGELVWDSDVQPEGITAGYSFTNEKMKIFDRLDLTVGEYLILQQNELDEASVFVAQVSGEKALTSKLDLFAALGWYRYSDLTPDGGLAFRLKNADNAIVHDEFVSRFSILNPIVALTYKGLTMPLTVSGEFIFNPRASRDDGQGWAVGASYGQTRKAKDWRLYYQYQHIDRDAVLSAVSQDDFTLATNFRGHMFGLEYQFTDAVGINLWTLLAERLSSDFLFASNSGDDQWRFRVDLNIKF